MPIDRDEVPARGASDFLIGGVETGALVRAHDWSSTPLSDPAHWSQPLKTLAAVMLGANQSMLIAWGPGRTLLYNDDYATILGDKHPAALGRDFLDVWAEIRNDLLPIVTSAYSGAPVQMDDIALLLHRNGRVEEAHFSFSYTPVRDESGGIAGFFCPAWKRRRTCWRGAPRRFA